MFPVTPWTQLDRFLCLGAEAGTYYVGERKLTQENAANVEACLALDAAKTVARIVEMSESGRIPKNKTAVFALALAASTGHIGEVARQDAVGRVCRTGTDLFEFVAACDELRGHGSGLRRVVGRWYAEKDPGRLAYLVTKYAQRGGWSHRDVLRRTGPPAPTPAHEAIYRWVATGSTAGLAARTVDRSKGKGGVKEYPALDPALLPRIVHAYEELKAAKDKKTVLRIVREDRVPREFLEGPLSAYLNDPEVWEALLPSMPLGALVRNLGKMTSVGLLKPLSAAAKTVAEKLRDADYVRKSGLHPLAVLLASRVYSQGQGVKGSLTWLPVGTVTAALDDAYVASFGNVRPSGKRTLIALDCSGSMSSLIAGTFLSCRDAGAALCMLAARVEPEAFVMGFAHPGAASRQGRAPTGMFGGGYGGQWGGGDPDLLPIPITAKTSLSDAVTAALRVPMGGTDCSVPMRYAARAGLEVDLFQVITDNETWAGPVHPCQALRAYREKTGIPAKLCVMGMTATAFSIADPNDPGSLDVVGFDAATPQIVADFARGYDAPPDAPAPGDGDDGAAD